MFSFKKSFAALVGLSLLVAAFAALLPPAGAAPADKGPRKFYLTKTLHNGSQALTACAAGYHMASMWEILDPSNLRYDTELGVTLQDSGLGPPSGGSTNGWIRTGGEASNSETSGIGNCNAWTSASVDDNGTQAYLASTWSATVDKISPWQATSSACAPFIEKVWCVQD